MKILVFGGGTIGLTCAWLLSRNAEVHVAARKEKTAEADREICMEITDLRKGRSSRADRYKPHYAGNLDGPWDLIIVTVNRLQLRGGLTQLQALAGKAEILFLMNHWSLREEVEEFLSPSQYLIGFPLFAGGGRDGQTVTVNLYKEAMPLGLPGSAKKRLCPQEEERLQQAGRAFVQAGVVWKYQPDMESWLKLHYLQQSVSAGAILKAGSYDSFAADRKAIRNMAGALREGVRVCEACGATVSGSMIRAITRLPQWLAAALLQKVLQDQATSAMVKGHMKKGLPEWSAGYCEVLKCGRQHGVEMPLWASYESCVIRRT